MGDDSTISVSIEIADEIVTLTGFSPAELADLLMRDFTNMGDCVLISNLCVDNRAVTITFRTMGDSPGANARCQVFEVVERTPPSTYAFSPPLLSMPDTTDILC